MMKKKYVSIMLLALLTAACSHTDKAKQADALYEKAQQEYQIGNYDDAMADLDSLRRNFHDEIEPRQKGIVLRKEIILKISQSDLAMTDSALQVESRRYLELNRKAEVDKSNGNATREELNTVIISRMKRDSLQIRFDVLCGQIRYIHKKQGEDSSLKK
jgi:predicted Zn-dependent protease